MPCQRSVRRLALMLILLAAIFLFTAGIVAAQASPATATVLVAKLNVRSGPGTSYARLGQVSTGDVLEVVGQAYNCGWLKVQTQELDGWVSGQRQYVKLSAACSKIPAATAAAQPAAPAASPITATVTATITAAETGVKPTVAPTATAVPTAALTAAPTAAPTAVPAEEPTPAATPEATAEATSEATAEAPLEAPAEDPLPADMGCFLIHNTVGPELNVTTTNKDNKKSGNFKVPAGGDMVWCLEPGDYAFTIDAPPPWADLNTDIKISAGERFQWTIYGKE